MSKPSNSHSQRERILAALKTGRRIPMPELSRIGSGKPDGHTACLNTRIHELRHDCGYDVRKVRDERVNGQRQTEYQLFRDGVPWRDPVRSFSEMTQFVRPPLPTVKKAGQGDLFL
jgi:hypothetical protein